MLTEFILRSRTNMKKQRGQFEWQYLVASGQLHPWFCTALLFAWLSLRCARQPFWTDFSWPKRLRSWQIKCEKSQTLFWNAATPRSSLLKGLNSNSLRRIYVTKIHTTLRTFHCKNTVHTDSYLTSCTSNGSFRGSFCVLNLDRCLESMDGRGCQLGPQRTFRWQAWL